MRTAYAIGSGHCASPRTSWGIVLRMTAPTFRTVLWPDPADEARRQRLGLAVITERVWRSGVEMVSRVNLAHMADVRHVRAHLELAGVVESEAE